MTLPPLETKCDACNGRGGQYNYGTGKEPKECRKCKGNGWIPTAAGQRILRLIAHDEHGVFHPYAF